MTRALVLTLSLLAVASSAHAQGIRPAAQHIAQAWQRGDVNTIGNLAATNGLSLDVGGERVGPVDSRRAAAILKRVLDLDDRETMSVSVGSAREMHGETKRAFVELTWVTRSRGTSIPDSTTVLFSLELVQEQWRITEIRLMR
jgi:hypothetical protein